MFVEPKRHVGELAGLTDREAMSVGLFTTKVARALMQSEGMDHIYTFVNGDGVPHVHVHVIGRYPGAPREYWGTQVDEWPDAPRGGWQEIEQLSLRLRTAMATSSERSP